MVWEYATAVAGRVLGIDPFDQPNVQESKDNTGKILDEAGDGPLPEGRPVFTDGVVEVHTDDPILLGGAHDLSGALAALLRAVPDRGYVAVMAYLDRHADSARRAAAPIACARRPSAPVTFGWAPRFLHSTGQYHKGGPQTGAFLQITGVVEHDLAIPGRPFGFARLQMAQALGDLRALQQRGRPAIRLHLLDRTGWPSTAARRRRFDSMSPVGLRRRCPTRCVIRVIDGCRGSPGRAASCSSVSPATSPARS